MCIFLNSLNLPGMNVEQLQPQDGDDNTVGSFTSKVGRLGNTVHQASMK